MGRAHKPLLAAITILLVAVGAVLWRMERGERSGLARSDRQEGRAAPAAVPIEGSRGVEDATAPVDAAVTRAPAAVPDVVLGASDGAILRGRIVDGAGAPIAGAVVLVRSALPNTADIGRRILAPLAGIVAEAGWSEAERVETRADGVFAVPDPPPGRVRLAVRAKTFAPVDIDVLVVPVDVGDLGEIVLSRGIALEGHVADANGRGASGVEIFVRGDDDPSSMFNESTWIAAGKTGPVGDFRLDSLAPGPWELLVISQEFPSVRVRGECASGTCSGLTIALPESFTIRGRVEGAALVPQDLVVEAHYRAPAGSSWDSETMRRRSVPVRPDGTFEFRGLFGPDGSWNLSVRTVTGSSGGRRPLANIVKAAPGAVDVVIRIGGTTRFLFRAIDARTNEAIAVPRVDLTLDHRLGMGVDTLPQADGSIAVDVVVPHGSTSLGFRIRAPLHEVTVFTLDPLPVGGVHDLGLVAMEPAQYARVRVIDARSGVPISGAAVRVHNQGVFNASAEPAASEHRRVPVDRSLAVTDSTGEALLALARGHEARFLVEALAYAPAECALKAADAAGERFLEVALSHGSSLVVRVRAGDDWIANSLVRLDSVRESSEFAWSIPPYSSEHFTDVDGSAVFKWLAAGRYRIGVALTGLPTHVRGATETVVEAGEQVVEIHLPPRTELSGFVHTGGRPIAGAIVQGRTREDGIEKRLQTVRAKTDGDGRFLLQALEPGPCGLLIEHPTLPIASRWTLHLSPGHNQAACDLTRSALRGRALDESDLPIAGLVLGLAAREDLSSSGSAAALLRTTTASDGAFAFEGLTQRVPLALVPEGGEFLPVDESIVLAPGEVREDWTFRLERAGMLHVVLDAPDGGPVRGRLVAEKDGVRREVELPQTREGTLRKLRPGVWSVCLRPIQESSNQVLVAPVDVVIEGGKTTELRLQIP